jgi:hypothetical protein
VAKLVKNVSSIDHENALIGEALKHFFRRNGGACEVGVILIGLNHDGFDIMQLGPTPISGRQLVQYITVIAEEASSLPADAYDG